MQIRTEGRCFGKQLRLFKDIACNFILHKITLKGRNLTSVPFSFAKMSNQRANTVRPYIQTAYLRQLYRLFEPFSTLSGVYLYAPLSCCFVSFVLYRMCTNCIICCSTLRVYSHTLHLSRRVMIFRRFLQMGRSFIGRSV